MSSRDESYGLIAYDADGNVEIITEEEAEVTGSWFDEYRKEARAEQRGRIDAEHEE